MADVPATFEPTRFPAHYVTGGIKVDARDAIAGNEIALSGRAATDVVVARGRIDDDSILIGNCRRATGIGPNVVTIHEIV